MSAQLQPIDAQAVARQRRRGVADSDGSKPLTNMRYERFCREYVKGGKNGLQAALKAGYAKKTAANQASRLINKGYILSRIDSLIEQSFAALHLGPSELLALIANDARADPRKLVDEHGNAKPLHMLDDATALSLVSVDLESTAIASRDGDEEALISTQARKYRFADKGKAKEMLMRYHGLFEREQLQGADAIGQAFAGVLSGLVGQRNGLGTTLVKLEPKA